MAGTFSPFTYGTNEGQFKMTPGNAAPALAVWLYLVTNIEYQKELDGTSGVTNTLVPVDKIAAATNLSEESVKQILGAYSATDPNFGQYYDSFRDVSNAFQAMADNLGYDEDHCPGGPMAIINLAKTGASVDPSATQATELA